MTTTPYITIDLDKIEHNTRTIVGLCNEHGIEVSGVTKVTCGHSGVANAMLRGGVTSIADSRLENIQRLKSAGIDSSYMLLRVPPLSAVDEVVELGFNHIFAKPFDLLHFLTDIERILAEGRSGVKRGH